MKDNTSALPLDGQSESQAKPVCEVSTYTTPVRLRQNTYETSRVRELKEKFQNRFITINEPLFDGDISSYTYNSPPQRPVSSPIPPSKPPRTFAHDVYVQEKAHLKALVEAKYRQNNSGPKLTERRRSKSVDGSDSTATTADTTASITTNANSKDAKDGVPVRRKVRPTVSDIFNDPIDENNMPQSASEVTEILNASFGKKYNATNNLNRTSCNDIGDIGARVTYAKTLRNQYNIRTISHFTSLNESNVGDKETLLCKFICDFDQVNSANVFYPICNDNQTKIDLVGKFTKCYKDMQEAFSWFTFADETLIHSYFYTHNNRTLAIGSELYSPQFFLLILKSILSNESLLTNNTAEELLHKKIPLPDETVNISGLSKVKVPRDSQITSAKPSILLTTITPESLYHLVSTLVGERKAVLVSSDPIKLTEASKAVISLLFPLYWDYMYWPVVPSDLVTWCAALTNPFFVGIESIHLSTFLSSLAKRQSQMFILDIDCGQVIMNVGDEDKILPKIHSSSVAVALNLAKNMCDPNDTNRDSVTREVFLTVFVQLLGPVTPHITEDSFHKEGLLNSVKSKCTRNFLRWFIESRTFENFKRYWQLRINYYKYVPPVSIYMFMDPFERKCEPFRTTHQVKKVNSAIPSKSCKESTTTNGSAMKGIESRFRAIKKKIVKSAFK